MGKISKAMEKSKDEFTHSFSSGKKSQKDQNKATFSKLNNRAVETIDSKNRTPRSKIRHSLNNQQPDRNLISYHKPNSIEAEQFRVLKNKILFPESGVPRRTIMVTSTSKGEGKSFVASNLSTAIAYSIDEYVLLVDSDLRHPSVHTMFGIENNEGLSTYLTNGVALSSLMVKTFIEKLTILPGGPPPANPSELISSEQMRRLIREVESRYDDRYIILDAPPPYITSEANALAKFVDGILLVVKQGHTRKDRLQDILEIYGREKVLGVVKNFAKGKFGLDYGYRYKYGYGNKR